MSFIPKTDTFFVNGKSVALRNFMYWMGQHEWWPSPSNAAETPILMELRPANPAHAVTHTALRDLAKIYHECYKKYELTNPALQQQCTSLTAQVSQLSSTCATTEAALKAERATSATLRTNHQAQLKSLEEKVEAQQEQKNRSLTLQKLLQQRIVNEEELHQICRTEFENQKNENIQNKRTIEELNAVIEQQKEHMQTLQTQNEQLQTKYTKEIKSLKINYGKGLQSQSKQLLDRFNKTESSSTTSSEVSSVSSSQASSADASDDENED
jgi:hypothetical protein